MQAFGRLRKFLIHFSYIGCEFRGMQKQLSAANTVQETLEEAIKFVFNPYHDVILRSSSRTDAGVHALHSTFDVAIQKEYDVNPDHVTEGLNKHFVAENIPIRISKCEVIPEWFSSRRSAISRKYLYRLAVRKEPTDPLKPKHLCEYPFSEYKRAYVVQKSNLNVDLMREAAAMLVGTHDFLTFMSRPLKKPPGMPTIRTLYSITITEGQPFMPLYDKHAQLFNYWDIVFFGKGFLHKQVRRTVGVLLAVGQGTMTLDDVQRLINKPVPESWDPRALCVPPCGLFLLEVNYNPLDFRIPQQLECEDYARQTYALALPHDT